MKHFKVKGTSDFRDLIGITELRLLNNFLAEMTPVQSENMEREFIQLTNTFSHLKKYYMLSEKYLLTSSTKLLNKVGHSSPL